VKNTITGIFVINVDMNSLVSRESVSDIICKIKGDKRKCRKIITYNSNVVINHNVKTIIIPIYFRIGGLMKFSNKQITYEYAILKAAMYDIWNIVPTISRGYKTSRYVNPGTTNRILNMIKIFRFIKTGDESKDKNLCIGLFFMTIY